MGNLAYGVDWGFYFCERDNVLTSVLVRLSLAAVAPDPLRPMLLIVCVNMKKPNQNGLSSIEESTVVDELTGQLEEGMVKATDAIFAGRLTGGGIWTYVFYSSSSKGLREAMEAAFSKFEGYEFSSIIREDPDWSVFLKSLMPQLAQERHQILNYFAIQRLRAVESTCEEAHIVSHFFNMPNAESWDRLLPEAIKLGLLPVELGGRSKANEGLMFCVERRETMRLEVLNTVVDELIQLASRYGGEYDGWEVVAKGE